MKRFVSSAIYMVAMFVAMTFVACNEYDEDDFSRPSRTYEVIVKTSADLTNAETVILNDALVESEIDTSSMRVQTNDVSKLASSIESRLNGINTAMMIGFRVQGHEEGRYAARVLIAGYNLN